MHLLYRCLRHSIYYWNYLKYSTIYRPRAQDMGHNISHGDHINDGKNCDIPIIDFHNQPAWICDIFVLTPIHGSYFLIYKSSETLSHIRVATCQFLLWAKSVMNTDLITPSRDPIVSLGSSVVRLLSEMVLIMYAKGIITIHVYFCPSKYLNYNTYIVVS